MTIKDLKNKKILILGFGVEGLSTLKFLQKHFPSKKIAVADEKELIDLADSQKSEIKSSTNIELFLGKKYMDKINDFDVIIKSPGVLPLQNLPASTVITSQTQLFFDNCKGKIIGITGTKGKSTTSALIHKILKDSNLMVDLVGNIGNPAISYLDSDTSLFVYELSSFQLEGLSKSPYISVFLNIYPEHLNYHGTYALYKTAKTNITKWQNKKDFLIYNTDQEEIVEIAKKSQASKIAFSLSGETTEGLYIKENNVYLNNERLVDIKNIPLIGKFNLNNVMAAIAVSKILKIDDKACEDSIKSFKPLHHRLEHVGEVNGVSFWNDSISTIPQATIAAIEALKPKIDTLILGGFDRGLDFTGLAKSILENKISNLVLFPTTGEKILECVKKQKPKYDINSYLVSDMKEAVIVASGVTVKNKICLLSPASASFGKFKSFEDRGCQFTKEVESLKENV